MRRFVRCDEDGVVTDVQTGLKWELEHRGPMTWDEALAYAKALRLGGHDDWRVPTVEELITLIDFSKYRPASAFPGMPNDYFWSSSSSYAGSASYAWYVNFDYGYVDFTDKTNALYVRCVRCVRRGPVDPSGLRPFDERLEKIEKRLDVLEHMRGAARLPEEVKP